MALDLTDIGVDGNSLRCLTPLIPCCRGSNGSRALGGWKFPNESLVSSRNTRASISRTRGTSSVLLHRIKNVMSPTGVYTCEIPNNSTITLKLNVYCYIGQITGMYFKHRKVFKLYVVLS